MDLNNPLPRLEGRKILYIEKEKYDVSSSKTISLEKGVVGIHVD
jgi:hypothetical protein